MDYSKDDKIKFLEEQLKTYKDAYDGPPKKESYYSLQMKLSYKNISYRKLKYRHDVLLKYVEKLVESNQESAKIILNEVNKLKEDF